MILDQAFARIKIRLHHFPDEQVKVDVALPAKYPLGLGRPSQELSTYVTLSAMRGGIEMERYSLNFGWTEVPRIYSNYDLSGLSISPDLIDAASRPSTAQQRLDKTRS